jgi:hypothetical protein
MSSLLNAEIVHFKQGEPSGSVDVSEIVIINGSRASGGIPHRRYGTRKKMMSKDLEKSY